MRALRSIPGVHAAIADGCTFGCRCADVLGRPQSSVQASRRRLHVNLGHQKKNNVLIRRLRHAPATPQALAAARNFECPAGEAAKHPRVARQSSPFEVQAHLKSIAMEEKELPGWMPGERVKTLRVVYEGSSMHAVVSFGDDDTETSSTRHQTAV